MFKIYVPINLLFGAILLPFMARAALKGLNDASPFPNLLARQAIGNPATCEGGATECGQVKLSNGNNNIVDFLDLAATLNNSKMPDSTTYCNNQNVICVGNTIAITLNVGIDAGVPNFQLVAGSPVTVDNINGAICAYIDGYNGTQPLYLKDLRTLMDQMYYNCNSPCASINLNWLNYGRNNWSGQLRIDWRSSGQDVCIDACIGDRQNISAAPVQQCTSTLSTPTFTPHSGASTLKAPKLFDSWILPTWWATVMMTLGALMIIHF